MYRSMSSPLSFLLAFLLVVAVPSFATAANFDSDFDIATGNGHATTHNKGEELHLAMDRSSGAGVVSKSKFLYGKFILRMKLVAGNSAGTVTTFYLSSDSSSTQDEIDFEFLGHIRGDLCLLQTNIFTQGKGNRVQRFHLWFDPTHDFHTYTVLWNPLQVIMYVDDIPVRFFRKNESLGVNYLEKQPMKVHASLWNGDDWATEGGTVKIDWSKAPFVAYYRDCGVSACRSDAAGSSSSCANDASSWMSRGLDAGELGKMGWAKKNYMIYNYCDKQGSDDSIRRECLREFS